MQPHRLTLFVAALGAACSRSSTPSVCPDGTNPVDDGSITVTATPADGAPSDVEGDRMFGGVAMVVAQDCQGILTPTCVHYLLVQGLEDPCEDRTLELEFRFENTDDPSEPVTDVLAEVRLRLPIEPGSGWATWAGMDAPVVLDSVEGSTFAVRFDPLELTPARGVDNLAVGRILLSGTLAGQVP